MSAEKNRVQKVLEDANIKVSSVVSDTFGVSGTAIIEALLAGELTAEEGPVLSTTECCYEHAGEIFHL